MSTADTATGLADELRLMCGAEHVIESAAGFSGDSEAWPQWMPPAVGVIPGTPDEIAAVLLLANRLDINVVPAGGFTYQFPRSPAKQEIVLYTSRLTDVEHYDPGDLTIGIGAGCTVAHLSARVAADGLLFAGDPPRPERATLGGLLATGMTGPLRHGYGGLRDYCIGIKFVTGDGRKGKGGGRVVKNVAGYDMMKLLIGSHGTLAVITGASFKLFPAPRQTRTFIAGFATSVEALKFRDAVLRLPVSPMCLELVSPKALGRLRHELEQPAWLICIRGSGSDAVLARYRAELGLSVDRELEGDAEIEWWRAVTNFPLNDEGGHEMARRVREFVMADTFAVSAPPSDLGLVIDRLEAAKVAGVSLVARAGIGQLRVSFWLEGLESSPRFLNQAIEELCKNLPAQVSLVTQTGNWLKTPTHLDSMRAVKRALDPNDILNRGRFPV